MSLRYRFDEHGGYDCITAAYKIIDDEREGLGIVATIDVHDFLDIDARDDWEAAHRPHAEAARYAKLFATSQRLLDALTRIRAEARRGDYVPSAYLIDTANAALSEIEQ